MSDEAVTYVKGDSVRIAASSKEKVAAEWEGFVPAGEQTDVKRADLQAQAKALGIPANQKNGDLQKAIANFEAEGGPETPTTDA